MGRVVSAVDMNIHSIFNFISPIFRKQRFAQFQKAVAPEIEERVLDVGGYPDTWTMFPPCVKSIDILNVHEIDFDPTSKPEYGIRTQVGDGCALPAAEKSYDIVFSNSVIEHVGTWERQQQFAEEIRRVGGRLWVQTPAHEFFIEPHYIAPFVHWLPKSLRGKLVRWVTPWGWLVRPNKKQVADRLDEIRLIRYGEMKALFPDCEILRERFCGVFTKSYIAFRGYDGAC